MTADCAPVLIYDPVNNLIGALHAGWKGAYKKIVSTTLRKFKLSGSNFKNLIVIIGPCIGKENYEVKNDFIDKFINQKKSNKKFFKTKRNKIYFSLNDYIKEQLR